MVETTPATFVVGPTFLGRYPKVTGICLSQCCFVATPRLWLALVHSDNIGNFMATFENWNESCELIILIRTPRPSSTDSRKIFSCEQCGPRSRTKTAFMEQGKAGRCHIHMIWR